MHTGIQRAIREKYDAIRHIEGEIEAIARQWVPGYHFLDYKVSNFWTCEQSPIGWCVFRLEERYGGLRPTTCKFCGQPVERK